MCDEVVVEEAVEWSKLGGDWGSTCSIDMDREYFRHIWVILNRQAGAGVRTKSTASCNGVFMLWVLGKSSCYHIYFPEDVPMPSLKITPFPPVLTIWPAS